MKNLYSLLLVLALVFVHRFNLTAQALIANGGSHIINANGSNQYEGSAQDYTIQSNITFNTLSFTLRGGDGGNAEAGTSGGNPCISNGGEGSTTEAEFLIGNGPNELNPGGTIRFIVGKYGVSGNVGGTANIGSGGGGGTAVLYRPNSSSNWTILAVAGGGGGAHQGNIFGSCIDGHDGKGGRNTENGGDGDGNNAGTGGTNGNGGNGGSSGGGGGAFSDGGNISKGGGAGFPDGGAGNTYGTDGGWGFGGGGCGENTNNKGGGGGGGYSGGGGGGAINCGGGGGSYVNSTYALSSTKTAGATGGSVLQNGRVEYIFSSTIIEWTGAIDNNWHNSGNWSPSRVPNSLDFVNISAANNDPHIWSGSPATAKVVRVLGGGELTIEPNATLNISPRISNGISNNGMITNDNGEINITTVGFITYTGILNNTNATFINKFGGVINIVGMDGNGIFNNSNSTFTNQLGGTINIGTVSGPIGENGIQNEAGGTFSNFGSLDIRKANLAGIQNAGTFSNNIGGYIEVRETGQDGILCTGGAFTNNGTTEIGQGAAIGDDGIENQSGSTFTNSGTLTIVNTTNKGIYNDGTFTNDSNATLAISQTGTIGIHSSAGSFNNDGGTINIGSVSGQIGTVGFHSNSGSVCTNTGTIHIRNTVSHGLLSYTDFTNGASGEIFIDQTGTVGLGHLGGTFENSGTISIGSIAALGGQGIQNLANFNNLAGGIITIDNTNSFGLANVGAATIVNEGLFKMGENGSIGSYAIFNGNVGNTCTFYNGNCGAVIHIFDGGVLDQADGFTNTGLILQESADASDININSGTILYNAGTFTANGNAPVSLSASFSGKSIWRGCNGSTWENAGNWYPAGIPTAADGVVIGPANTYPQINNSAQARSVLVEQGNLFNNGTLSVTDGDLDINLGATVQGNGQYYLSGDFKVDGGTFNAGNSTVTMTGATDAMIMVSGGAQTNFYNLVVDKPSDKTVSINSTVSVTHELTINSGDLAVNGTLNCPSLHLPNGTDVTNAGYILVQGGGSFWIQSGASAQGNGGYFLQGDFLLDGGTFTPGTSSVTFVGTGTQSISPDPVSFYNLVVDKPSDQKVIFEDVMVTNALTVSAGDLEITNGHFLTCPNLLLESGSDLTNNGSLTCAVGLLWVKTGATAQGNGLYTLNNNFTVTPGATFIPGTSTVIMTGAGNRIIGNSAIDFYNLEINKTSGGSVKITGNLTVSNELNLVSGNLDLNNKTIELTGSGTILGESAASYIYSSTGAGVVKKTVDLNAPTSENPGNIGVAITSAANPGLTTIQRGHTVQNVNGDMGIFRYYDISPANNTGLNATVRFHYLDHELNNIPESELTPFRYNGSIWDTYFVSATDASANWVETILVNAFSTWTLASFNANFPVELVHFSTSKTEGGVLLEWQTASELNNEGFAVEHSTDVSNWDYLGFVEGQGTSMEAHDYQFIHGNPTYGENYYRLRQVDFDGKFEYSDIRSVEFGGLEHQIKVFPNPAKTHFNVQISDDFRQASIRVFDLSGRLVFEQELDGGNQSLVIDVNAWPSEIYLIRVVEDGRSATHKLQVQKD
ncbi:MAG: T9SS type A sorting domain-containing protein [Bacteroidia bacterium]